VSQPGSHPGIDGDSNKLRDDAIRSAKVNASVLRAEAFANSLRFDLLKPVFDTFKLVTSDTAIKTSQANAMPSQIVSRIFDVVVKNPEKSLNVTQLFPSKNTSY
jgi:hypothetical protein